MVLFVKACDHIIGPDEVTSTDVPTGESVGRRLPRRDHRPAERRPMTADNIIALVLAVLLTGYLVASLVFPEKF